MRPASIPREQQLASIRAIYAPKKEGLVRPGHLIGTSLNHIALPPPSSLGEMGSALSGLVRWCPCSRDVRRGTQTPRPVGGTSARTPAQALRTQGHRDRNGSPTRCTPQPRCPALDPRVGQLHLTGFERGGEYAPTCRALNLTPDSTPAKQAETTSPLTGRSPLVLGAARHQKTRPEPCRATTKSGSLWAARRIWRTDCLRAWSRSSGRYGDDRAVFLDDDAVPDTGGSAR